jgi:hypothetical protein
MEMTQEDLDKWYATAKENYFPDDDSKTEGYLEALQDLAEKLHLLDPARA